MPIDASIPLSVRAPQIDIMGQYAQLMGLRAQQEQTAALAEQRRAVAEQRRMQVDAAKREQDEGERLRAAFAGDTPPSPGQIYSIVGVERGKAIVDGLDALTDREMKRYKDGRDVLAKVVVGLKALPESVRAETYDAAVKEFVGRGWLDGAQIPPYGPGVLDRFEAELLGPQGLEARRHNQASEANAAAQAAALASDRAADNARQEAAAKEAARHNRAMESKAAAPAQPRNPIAVMGPDGQPVLVDPSEAVGKRPANMREQGRNVTSGDAGRVAEFDTSLDDVAVLRETISGLGATGTVAKVGASLPNWATELTGWTGPKKKQAVIDRVKQVIGKALEGGVLRKEDEYKYEKILPTIADADDVVQTKLDGLESALRQRRQRFLDSLEDANYDVSRYNARGEGAAVLVKAPNGKTYQFKNQAEADAFKRKAGIP